MHVFCALMLKFSILCLLQRILRGYLIFVFSSPITQNMWVPWLNGLFGNVFSFCFHHSIFWFLSDELWKLKTHFKCFQVIETKVWCIFVNTHTMRDPPTTTFDSLSSHFFFFLLHYSFFFLYSSIHSFFLFSSFSPFSS